MSDKPTEEGKRRWPPDGFYDCEACTCEPDCPPSCKGYPPACKSKRADGCEADQTSYNDDLSMPDS